MGTKEMTARIYHTWSRNIWDPERRWTDNREEQDQALTDKMCQSTNPASQRQWNLYLRNTDGILTAF